MKRKWLLFWILVAAQCAVLVALVADRERLLASGARVLLRCDPVDPRSLFSGDYVILNYGVSTLAVTNLGIDAKTAEAYPVGKPVYVALTQEQGGPFHHAARVATDRAAFGDRFPLVIRGTLVLRRLPANWLVRYGIEEYFVPQAQGRRIETNLAAVSARVALGADGAAALVELVVDGKAVEFR